MQRTTRVNASEETIKIGPLAIRFLLTGDDSNGSVSVFEFRVPASEKLAAPAHKNDAFEEVLYGIEGETARRHISCDHGARVLPGSRRGHQRRRRRSA